MRELLNLFAETESRDELGIGQVRDAFSDLLFPGTSTLHTRARYLLIVPWCYREAEQRRLRGVTLAARVEQNERRVIKTLKDAGHVDGLIGRVAGVAVKTLPSAIYWGALGQYRIRMNDGLGTRPAHPVVQETDELADRPVGDWTPTLPPLPEGFPAQLDGGLDLMSPEAAWLRERMRLGARDTLLDHLLQEAHRPSDDSWAPWVDSASAGAPAPITQSLRHAELFSLAMHGAALLYNLLVAQRYEKAGLTTIEQPVSAYREELLAWTAEIEAEHGWTTWDREAMWDCVIGQNARIASNVRLRAFVNEWLDAVFDGKAANAEADAALRRLVGDRERAVKLAQSRLINDRLLRTWSGDSGTRRLTFRWTQVRRIVLDVHRGLETDDAAS